MDYNAYGFHANDPYRRIGRQRAGQPVDPRHPKGEGLRAWQEFAHCDPHSLQLEAGEVKFAQAPTVNTWDPRFWKFWGPYRTGEKVPTLALFDLPADSPLNHAGENGAPIGARSPGP